MYDRRWRVGRIAYEIRSRLLVDPRVLRFDPAARRLADRLDAQAIDLEETLPEGWSWSARPVAPAAWGLTLPAPASARRWLLSGHDRHARSVGYRTDPTWSAQDPLLLQLALISRPLEDGGEAGFRADLRHVVARCLPELLDLRAVGVWPVDEGRQLPLDGRLELVLDDPSWSGRGDVLRKLAAIGTGLWLLVRHREQLAPEAADHDLLLLDHLGEALARPDVGRHDLLTNLWRLWEAWLAPRRPLDRRGRTLDRRWLARVLTGRAHLAVLAQVVAETPVLALVRGTVRLTRAELAELSPRDFALWRDLGVDLPFLDLFAAEPGDRDPAVEEAWRLPFHREGLVLSCPMEDLVATVRATVLDGRTPPLDPVAIPLCRARATPRPGAVSLEIRALSGLVRRRCDRWPYRYREVAHERGTLRLIDPAHLYRLGLDTARLVEVAAVAGDDLVRRLVAGDPAVTGRDAEALAAHAVPRLRYLLRSYARPRW